MEPVEKTTFYFVRHGQTDANARGLMCGGEWDIELNETGQEQATKLADKVARLNPSITKLCVSPMLRAQQTAKHLNSILKAPKLTVEGLREWCVGEWEGRPWDDVPNPFNTTEDPPAGETRSQFEDRVLNAVKNSLKSHHDEVLLFVSHGAVAHALFTLLGVDSLKIENCALYQIYADGLHWKLKKL